MKVATNAPLDFNAMRQHNFCHAADYKLLELEYKKRAYAVLYDRYKKLMEMHEAGITVTVTLTSAAGTMTLEDCDQFEPMEYLNHLSKCLSARADEIIDLTEQEQQGLLMGTTDKDREEITLQLQVHALCMPQSIGQPLTEQATPVAKAA